MDPTRLQIVKFKAWSQVLENIGYNSKDHEYYYNALYEQTYSEYFKQGLLLKKNTILIFVRTYSQLRRTSDGLLFYCDK